MSCCCYNTSGIGRFFSRFARRYRRRFEKYGLEKSQKQLVAGLPPDNLQQRSLLEIGCGVGYLHQSLLKAGASRATGIDLSDQMVKQAAELAASQGLADRTQYLQGDFVALAEGVGTADITILDKVICCYPDAESLVKRSADKTLSLYAFTIPRYTPLTRILEQVGRFLTWVLRIDMRAWVHNPADIDRWLQQAGFQPVHLQKTLIWQSQVFRKA